MEKTESAVHEEPTMCTKKEKIGHAIGVWVMTPLIRSGLCG